MRKTIPHIALTLLIIIGSGASCTYDPVADFPQPDALIVVDGWIEQGRQAKVFLTTNTPYFTSVDSASIRDLVLSRAKVTLTDGDQSEVLILRKDERYFPPYYYAGNNIFGDTGKVYTLTAEYGGKSVTSQTTVPAGVMIDHAFFEPLEPTDTLGKVTLTFTDPPEKNYYRIFTMREGKDDKFIPTVLMAVNDQYFNGEQVNFEIYRAPESLLSSDETDYFHMNDTIIVKLCTVDRSTFEFWNDYQEEVMNATNPFASSMIDIRSNIEGDGLGIWGGYGVTTDTIFPATQ